MNQPRSVRKLRAPLVCVDDWSNERLTDEPTYKRVVSLTESSCAPTRLAVSGRVLA
jgi:hypothetical protein